MAKKGFDAAKAFLVKEVEEWIKDGMWDTSEEEAAIRNQVCSAKKPEDLARICARELSWDLEAYLEFAEEYSFSTKGTADFEWST